MSTDNRIIYVAGNPDLYPLEYYDPESQTYQGAIPAFLAEFAQEYGYDLRYFQPGKEDRRAHWADNQQVDLISGCLAGERYAHTAGEPVLLFSAEADGEEVPYLLHVAQVAPGRFQSDLRDYAARTSQGQWTGSLIEAAGEPPSQQLPLAAWGAAIAFLLLAAALAYTIYRLRQERKRQARLRLFDPETGLGTQAALEDAFSRLERDQKRKFYYLICLRLNLERVGYLRGQDLANSLLLHASGLLKEAAGPGDTAAQLGDGRLVALKQFPSEEGAARWAEEILKEVHAFSFGGSALGIWGASVGICPLETAYLNFRQALFHAGQCALAASRSGAGCQLWQPQLDRASQERWQLLADFEKGLQREEFLLYLQFFVDAATFRVVGGEALSRWKHPRFGFLSPGRYIPLLEEAGRIRSLDLYGLEKTCAFLEELDRLQVKNFFISCNFARTTFSAADFVEQCLQIIGRYSFTRKLLILEVTESQEIGRQAAEQMLQNILALREFGVRVIFDDFGMGFSSFHDLQAYPMDGLKLDKELVDNMWTKQGRIILNALVETGHRMGLTILAEGVEEERQIEVLQSLHCDVFQGFRFFVPLPAEEAKSRILGEAASPHAPRDLPREGALDETI